jgi:hypothetical protein
MKISSTQFYNNGPYEHLGASFVKMNLPDANSSVHVLWRTLTVLYIADVCLPTKFPDLYASRKIVEHY